MAAPWRKFWWLGYSRQEARRAKEVEEAERELAACSGSPEDVEKIIRFAERFFSGLDQTWPGLDLRQKQVFQSAIFPAGLTFDGKEPRTTEIPLFFNVIAQAKRGKSKMASHRVEDWNRVEAWVRAMRVLQDSLARGKGQESRHSFGLSRNQPPT